MEQTLNWYHTKNIYPARHMEHEYRYDLSVVFDNSSSSTWPGKSPRIWNCPLLGHSGFPKFAISSDDGEVRVYGSSIVNSTVIILTDNDICAIAFAIDHSTGPLTSSSSTAVMLSVHDGGFCRMWSSTDGSLRREFELHCNIRSVHNLDHAGKHMLVELDHGELKVLNVASRALASPVSGYHKGSPLRFLCTDPKSGITVLIDAHGHVHVFRFTNGALKHLFSEKQFNESFQACVLGSILAVVCPMKVIFYDTSGDVIVPLRSVMAESADAAFVQVLIMSPTTCIATTRNGFLELFSESFFSNFPPSGSLVRLSGSSFISVAPGAVHHCSVVGKEILSIPLTRAVKPEKNLTCIASDGIHYFFVQSSPGEVRVVPLSVPSMSFLLDLPSIADLGAVSAVAGFGQRIFAGFEKGYVCSWMTGSSTAEYIINVHALCAIVLLLETGSAEIACVDGTGTISLLSETGKVMGKIRPNLLLPLLMRGYAISVAVSGKDVTVTLQQGERKIKEVWSLNPSRLVSSEKISCQEITPPVVAEEVGPDPLQSLVGLLSLRRNSAASVQTVSAEKLEHAVKVAKKFPFEKQILTLNVGSADTASLKMLYCLESSGWTVGVSTESVREKSVQVGYSLSRGCSETLLSTLLTLVEETVRPRRFLCDSDSAVDVQPICVRSMVTVLLDPKNARETRFTALSLVRKEVLRQWAVTANAAEAFHSCPVLLIVLGAMPHMIPGYREAVRGVERCEYPFSERITALVSVTEEFLKKVISTRDEIDISILTDSFWSLKKLIVDKNLISKIFSSLVEKIVPEDRACSVATKCVLAIGIGNPSKFSKRLGGLLKTSHSAVLPLSMVRNFVENFTRHSIRFLPAFFEDVVLRALDPMDYRIRKSSIDPITELFKTLNRLYPMTAFQQAKQKFALGTTQGQVMVYDVRSGTKWRILDGHTGAISAVGFDASGKHLCSYSATDCTVRVWHFTGGGMTGVTALIINGNSSGSMLSGLLGGSGGKCIQVKQLGSIDEDVVNGIKHPFNLVYRIHGVKIRWTSETDILIVRENGQGIQVRL